MNMIKIGQKITLCLTIVLGVGVVAPILQPAVAHADAISEACNLAPDSEACKGMQGEGGFTKIVGNIINTTLMIVGILAVAMIIFLSLISFNFLNVLANPNTPPAYNAPRYMIVS